MFRVNNLKMITIERYYTVVINAVFLTIGILEFIIFAVFTGIYLRNESFVGYKIGIVFLILTICGFVTLVLGLGGCFGLAMKSRIGSFFYFGLIAIIILTKITLSIVWLYNIPNYNDFIQNPIKEAFKQIKMEERRLEWTTIQYNMNCCGVSGPEDYLKVGLQIPVSCSKNISEDSTVELLMMNTKSITKNESKNDGCKEKLYRNMIRDSIIVCTIAIMFALVSLIVLIAGCCIQFQEIYPPTRAMSELGDNIYSVVMLHALMDDI